MHWVHVDILSTAWAPGRGKETLLKVETDHSSLNRRARLLGATDTKGNQITQYGLYAL